MTVDSAGGSGSTTEAVLPEGRVERPPAVEVALLDREGVIVAVNDAWNQFCLENGGDPDRCGVGMSYLDVCAAADDSVAREIAAAIRAAIAGDLPAPMRVVLPCHPPEASAWFEILISSRLDDDLGVVGATVTLSAVEESAAGLGGNASEMVPDVAPGVADKAAVLPQTLWLPELLRLPAALADEPAPSVALPKIVLTIGYLLPERPCGLAVRNPDGRSAQLYEAHGDRVVARRMGAQPEQPLVELLERTTGLPLSSLLVVPIELRSESLGVLYVSQGVTGPSTEHAELLASLAATAALVITHARAVSTPDGSARRPSSYQHEGLVSELQAIALGLRSLLQHVARSDQQLLPSYVEALHDMIGRIGRSTARLQAAPATAASLKQRVLDVLDEETSGLAVQASVEFDGPLDQLSAILADDVVAVVGEGLRNAVRHARPDLIEVVVSLEEVLVVSVADDGSGAVSPSRGSGLFDLRRRAAARGGVLEVVQGEAGGTQLNWTVPAVGSR